MQEIANWLQSHGLAIDGLNADGQIQRVRRHQYRDKSAWYVAWPIPFPIAVAGDWRTGEKWEYKGVHKLDRQQSKFAKEQISKAIAVAVKEREDRAQWAAFRADIELRSGKPATGHPYLVRKQIEAFGTVALDDQLLIPTVDINGKLCGLQRILADGGKFFLSGQRFKGCFYPIGAPSDQIYICEGFATGASIQMATGAHVLCAFALGNLMPVAVAAHRRSPKATIVVTADNDAFTPGNPGLAAAEKIRDTLFLPITWPTFDQGECLTDFNDLACSKGLDEVRRQLLVRHIFEGKKTPELLRNYAELMR